MSKFFDTKYAIVPDKIPEYHIGETLVIIGRTPIAGERVTVVEIWPCQKTVVYKVKRANGRKTELNEHMLERILK